MNQKIKLALYGAAFSVAGLIAVATPAFASVSSTPVTVPTDLAAAGLSFAGLQIADPGTETLLLIAIGLPLAFWLVHKIRGLVPGSTAKK